MKKKSLYLAALIAVLLTGLVIRSNLTLTQEAFGAAVKLVLAEEMCGALYAQFVPAISLMKEEPTLLQSQIIDVMPLYGYAQVLTQSMEEIPMEEFPIGGGSDEGLSNGGFSNGGFSNDGFSDEGLSNENEGELFTERLSEEDHFTEISMDNLEVEEPNSLNDLLQAENEAALLALAEQENTRSGIFIPHTAQKQIDLGALGDYETLVQNFYTIDSNTMAGSDQLNVDTLMSYDMTIDKSAEGPQILIYHTHSQEAFADSVPGDESTTIIGVGEHLAQILTERYGYRVLHHVGKYDVDSRNDAYSTALPEIEKVLAENPSIQVVIDLHRDEMPEATHLAMDLDGRPTARFMFFNGLSRTKRTGSISYLVNEYQEDNLAFSFQMQLAAETYYPGLARRIYLKGYRYNMHLRPRSLLIELGAQNNTLEEVMNACDPIAHILDTVLSGQ